MRQDLRDLDWGGIVLYSGGLTSFVLGLSWGGGLYPWASYHVLVPLILGFFILVAFAFYGTFSALSRISWWLMRNRGLHAVEVSTDPYVVIFEWTVHGASRSRIRGKRTLFRDI